MSRELEWFRCFRDIPGVDWPTPPGIDRSRLRGHDAEPERWSGARESLWWPIVYSDDGEEIRDGSTGQPPAGQYPIPDGPRTVAEESRRLAEALELPGYPDTYHGLMADAAGHLFKIRLREPAALREAERLCLFDLELLQARPEILARRRELLSDIAEDQMPVWVSTVRLLHRMYTETGDLNDAERIACFAVEQLGQRFDRQLAEARERLAVLEGEDA